MCKTEPTISAASVALLKEVRMVGDTGIEPVTPSMSTKCDYAKVVIFQLVTLYKNSYNITIKRWFSHTSYTSRTSAVFTLLGKLSVMDMYTVYRNLESGYSIRSRQYQVGTLQLNFLKWRSIFLQNLEWVASNV